MTLPPARRLATVRGPSAAGPRRSAGSAPAPIVLNRYRLHSRLGSGGFGTVWMARDERLDRDVAVKILARERVQGGRFEREARAAARLTHPGIVTLYEAGADDEGAYLVSELVRGATLERLLEAGQLSDRDIVAIGIAICEALAHAHAAGVVHRDVKPSNVLVPERPATPAQVAKLTDFGVARVLGGDPLTRTGDVLGTAAYMAPEQAEGREAGAAADLYSLALVIYEALSGVNPVRSGLAAQRARRLGAHLPPLRRQRRDLPREIGHGIDLALRPRARERGRVEDLHAALSATLDLVGENPGVVARPWRPRPHFRARAQAPYEDPETAGRASYLDRGPERPAEPTAGALAPARARRGQRMAAAAITAALTAWLCAHVLRHPLLPPGTIAIAAAAAVAVLPRLAWVALTIILTGALALEPRPGAALVVMVGGLLPVASLPRDGFAWPLAAVAPALGAVGLAGAWPALAARAGSVWRRAMLGALGWLWLLLAQELVGSGLYLGRLPGAPSPAVWMASAPVAVHGVLGPLVSSGAVAPAAVWALGAASLPGLVRSRRFAFDVVAVTLWAAAVASASTATVAAFQASPALDGPRTAALGAVASATVALAPGAARFWRSRRERAGPWPGLA